MLLLCLSDDLLDRMMVLSKKADQVHRDSTPQPQHDSLTYGMLHNIPVAAFHMIGRYVQRYQVPFSGLYHRELLLSIPVVSILFCSFSPVLMCTWYRYLLPDIGTGTSWYQVLQVPVTWYRRWFSYVRQYRYYGLFMYPVRTPNKCLCVPGYCSYRYLLLVPAVTNTLPVVEVDRLEY